MMSKQPLRFICRVSKDIGSGSGSGCLWLFALKCRNSESSSNSRHFILRPTEHARKYNVSPDIPKPIPAPPRKRPHSTLDSFVTSKKNTLVSIDGELSTKHNCTATSQDKTRTITVKTNIKLRHIDIASLLDPKISITAKPRDKLEAWAQNYALSVILTGVNKNISQAATVYMYDTTMVGLRGFYDIVFGDVEVDGKRIPPPPKVHVNNHNITLMEKGLLEAFKTLDVSGRCNVSTYKALRGPFSKWYSLFHDGIQKFGMELNGVMIRTLDEELTGTNIPWALTKIPGGSMSHQKLCSQILNQIQTVNKVEPSADSEILGKLEKLEPEIIHPHPPPFFKCCKLVSVDFDTKHVELCFENWPVAIVADGCGVNHKALEVLTNEIGLLTPSARRSGHAASGSIKRMASSETFCVPKVVTFAAGLQPI